MRSILIPVLLATALPPTPARSSEVGAADRLLHEQLLVLDTHLDTPANFEREGWAFDTWHNVQWDGTQVDLPRMEAGGLDGGFFVIYTAQGPLTPEAYAAARESALMRAAAIRRVVAENRNRLGLATTAEHAERLHREGKRIVFQSIENSYPLGTDLSLLSVFHRMGVRMAGPVHNGTNQLADSAQPNPGDVVHNGLSPLGRQWVAEMNRLGMVIDGSHSSPAAIDEMIRLSRTPVILSHSGPSAIFAHRRNIDDAQMRRLAQSGGVMQINTLFLRPSAPVPALDRIAERQARWETLTPAERERLAADRDEAEAHEPSDLADLDLFMRALNHAIRVMGIDHVGIGADWDGGGGLSDMPDITSLPRITARLRTAGFSRDDIQKIWGGNLLRVLRQAEAAAGSS